MEKSKTFFQNLELIPDEEKVIMEQNCNNQAIKKRIDFVWIFDVKNGNPNGDPDMANQPRIDPFTGCGVVTDVCLKRKIRNYVSMFHGEIWIKELSVLSLRQKIAYDELKISKSTKNAEEMAQKKMCELYYDVRTFGAVMPSKNYPCGTVRGPVQLTYAQSVDPITIRRDTITRMASYDGEEDGANGSNRTMGSKYIVPYAMYVAHGFINPFYAEKTGFSEKDLDILFESILNAFEHDRSSARGEMSTRKLVVMEHDNPKGVAHASDLFDLVQIKKRQGVEIPKSFSDYEILVLEDKKPKGITIKIDYEAIKS